MATEPSSSISSTLVRIARSKASCEQSKKQITRMRLLIGRSKALIFKPTLMVQTEARYIDMADKIFLSVG